MRWVAWAALAALLASAAAAEARQHYPARGHRIMQSGAPLDGFAQPAAAYSLRRLRSAYSGPAIRLRRASDNLELDINFLGFVPGLGAPLDTAAANAHCASTTCFLRTWYDQSGNGRAMTATVPANQPAYLANCNGTLPCARTTLGASQAMASSAVLSTPPGTLNAVTKTTVRGGTGCYYLTAANNALQQHGTLDSLILSNGGTTITAPAAAFAWHSHTGVMNGASGVVRVDAAETAGSITATTANSTIYFLGDTGATCDHEELIWWNGYALTAGERAALQTNQKSFWGTP